MNDEELPLLSPEQSRRATAIRVAREVLGSRLFAPAGAVDPSHLIEVAEWVLTGDTHPYLEGSK